MSLFIVFTQIQYVRIKITVNNNQTKYFNNSKKTR